jgi:chromosome segregation ATPase
LLKQRKFGTDLLSSKNQIANIDTAGASNSSSYAKNTKKSLASGTNRSSKLFTPANLEEKRDEKTFPQRGTSATSTTSTVSPTTAKTNKASSHSPKRNYTSSSKGKILVYSSTLSTPPPSFKNNPNKSLTNNNDEVLLSRGTTTNVKTTTTTTNSSSNSRLVAKSQSSKKTSNSNISSNTTRTTSSNQPPTSPPKIYHRNLEKDGSFERAVSTNAFNNTPATTERPSYNRSPLVDRIKKDDKISPVIPNKNSTSKKPSLDNENFISTSPAAASTNRRYQHHPLPYATPPTLAIPNTTTATTSNINENKKSRSSSQSTNTTSSIIKQNQEDPSPPSSSYTVEFDYGKPLGMQLEPVIKSSAREIGCRVVRFIDHLVYGMESAARTSGQVHVGDVIVAVDGINVLSKSYEGIIEALKSKPQDGSSIRRIKFRNVQKRELSSLLFSEVSKGNSTNTTKSHSSDPFQVNTSMIKKAATTPIGKKNLFTEDFIKETTKDSSNIDYDICLNPIKMHDNKRHHDFTSEPNSMHYDVAVQKTPSCSHHDAAVAEETIFSPSTVRKYVQSSASSDTRAPLTTITTPHQKGYIMRTLPETIRKVIQQSVIQPANSIASSTIAATARTIGEILIGHSTAEFEEAIRLKHELLQELSKAKADIGGDKDKIKQLEHENEELRRDHDFLRLQSMMTCSDIFAGDSSPSFLLRDDVTSTEYQETAPFSVTKQPTSNQKAQKHREQFLNETLASLSLEDQVGTLRTLSEDQRKRIAVQLRELLKQKDQIKDLSSKIQQLASELSASNEALHDARSSLHLSNEVTDQLKVGYDLRIKHLEDNIKSLQLRSEDAKQREEKLKSDVKIRDNTIKNLENSSKIVEQVKNSAQSELEDMQHNLSETMDRLMDMESQLKFAKREAFSLASSYKEKSQQTEALHIELEGMRALNEKLADEKNTLMVQISKEDERQNEWKICHEGEMEGLRALLHRRQEAVSEYQEVNERMNKEFESLHADLAEKESLILQLKSEIISVEKQRDSALSASQQHADAVQHLKEENRGLIHEISVHENQKKSLTEEHSTLSIEHEAVQHELLVAKSELHRIKSKLLDAESCNASLADQNNHLQRAAKDAENCNRSKVEMLQKQVADLQEDLKRDEVESKAVEAELNRKIALMDQKLQLFEDSSSKMKCQLQQASFQLLSKETELELNKKEMKLLIDDNGKMKEEISQILHQAELAEKKLREKITALEDEKSLLLDENSAQKKEEETRSAELNELKCQLHASQEKLTVQLSETAALQQENRRLTNIVESSSQSLACCEEKMSAAINEKDSIIESEKHELAEVYAKMSELESEKENLQTSYDSALNRLNEAFAAKQVLEDRILQTELEHKECLDVHKSELRSKEALIEQMTLDLDEAKKTLLVGKMEAMEEIKKIGLIKQELSEVLSEKEEAYKALSSYNTELSSHLEEKTHQLLNLTEDMNALQIQLQDAVTFRISAENEIKLARSLHQQADDQLKLATKDFQEKIRASEDKLAKKHGEAAAIQLQLNHEIDYLKSQLLAAADERQAMKLENIELSSKVLDTEQSNVLLRESLVDLEKKLNEQRISFASTSSIAAKENFTLKNERQQTAAENYILQDQLQASQETINVKLSEIAELQEEKRQLTNIIESSTQRLAFCEDELSAAVSEKLSKIEGTARELAEVYTKLKKVESEKANRQSSYDEAVESLNEVVAAKKVLEDRILQMELEHKLTSHGHKAELHSKEALIQQMTLDFDEAKRELSKALQLKEEMYKALSSYNTELSSQLEDKSRQLLNLTEEMCTFHVQLQEAETFKVTADSEIELLRSLHQQATDHLKLAMEDFQEKVRALEEKLANKHDEASAIQLQLNHEIDCLKSQLRVAEEEFQTAKLEKDQFSSKLIELEQHNMFLKENIVNLEKKLSEETIALANNASVVAKENAALKNEQQQLTTEINKLQSQLYASQEAHSVELSESTKLREEKRRLSAIIESITQSLTVSGAKLRDAINEKDSISESTKHELTELYARVKEVELERAYYQSSYDDAIVRLNEVLAANQALDERILQTELEHEVSLDGHNSKLSAKEALIEGMKTSLDGMPKDCVMLQNKTIDCEKEMTEGVSALKKCDSHTANQSLIQNMFSEINYLQKQLHTAREALKDQLLKSAELQAQKKTLMDEIQSHNLRVAVCEAEMSAAIFERDSIYEDSKVKSVATFAAIEEIESEFHHLKVWFDQMFSKNQRLEAKISEMEHAQRTASVIHETELISKESIIRQMESDLVDATTAMAAFEDETRKKGKEVKVVTNEMSEELLEKEKSLKTLVDENSQQLVQAEVISSELLKSRNELNAARLCAQLHSGKSAVSLLQENSSSVEVKSKRSTDETSEFLKPKKEDDMLHNQSCIFSAEVKAASLQTQIISGELSGQDNARQSENKIIPEKKIEEGIMLLNTENNADSQKEIAKFNIEDKGLILAENEDLRFQLHCAHEAIKEERSKKVELEELSKTLAYEIELNHKRLSTCEATLNDTLEKVAKDNDTARKLLEAQAAITELRACNKSLQEKVDNMRLEMSSLKKNNDDLLLDNSLLQEVLESRELNIHSLFLELKVMNAKLSERFHDGVKAEIIGTFDEDRVKTLKPPTDNWQVKSIEAELCAEGKGNSNTEKLEDICSLRHYDLYSMHSKILEDLQGINQAIFNASSEQNDDGSSMQLVQDPLNTSLELERDLLVIEIEQRDELLQKTSKQIDEVVNRLSNMAEMLHQKEQLLLVFAERAESKDLHETCQRDDLQEEIDLLNDNVRSLKEREEELQHTICHLQEEIRSTADEVLIWKTRFFGNDEKWSVKVEASKELSQCIFKLITRAAIAKQSKIAKMGVAFGTWKTVANCSSICYKSSKVEDPVVVSSESHPQSSGISASIGENNNNINHVNGEDNMKAQIKLAAARIIVRNMAKHILTAEARAFRLWSCVACRSKAFSDHVGVAEQMANQLDATRLKLNLLRKHLQDAGIIQQTAITVKKSNKRPAVI